MSRPAFLPDVPLKNVIWGLELPLLVLNGLALTTAVAAWHQVEGLVLPALSLGVCLLVAGLGLRKTATGPKGLTGRYVLSRLTLVYAVFGLYSHPPGESSRLNSLVPAIVVAACLLAEPVAKAFKSQAFPYAAGFPGVRTRTTHLPEEVVFWSNLTATTVITTLGHRAAELELVVAVATAVINVVSLVDMALFTFQRLRFNARLPQIWEQMQPRFAVHWQAARGSIHQVTMWIDSLKALGQPFFLITRTRENFLEATQTLDVPVLHRVGLDAVEDALSPSLKTVFYVNTAILNDHMLRYPHLTHIQLNHGDSDKVASYSPVFRAYDKDFVAGQAAIDRFAAAGLRTAPEFFVIVGRPQVAGVRPPRGSVGSLANPVALYAPTWWGNTQDSNYTSLPQGSAIVRALLERGCTVVFRPHPYWAKNHHTAAGRQAVVDLLARDAQASGREHIYGSVAEQELSVFDCFNLSDFMVSDVSSVVNDYLFSRKPLVMMAVTTSGEQFREEFPVARGAYVVDYNTLDTGLAGGGLVEVASDAAGAAPGLVTAGAVGSDTARGVVAAGETMPDAVNAVTDSVPLPAASTLPAALDCVFGADPLAATRESLGTYYLGDIPRARYAERFIEEASKYV
ncbi:MAG: CDP-glycerol glycerophosphotransferase family protein [Bifidobacteriaceae bacterium]|jgi:hypothetical protein|nr:CDP-glycerol glycerophosphotransferase family protein [Bifidobacteriaceae bacterium]